MKKFILTFSLLLLALVASAELKYVFLMIGDGMGMGHVLSAETYNRMVLKNNDKLLMMQFPVASMALTYSASSPVTDSAAAGTALATGSKTNNHMVGMKPNKIDATSVASQLKSRGWGVGIITSVAFDDATPATQYAHQADRSMYEGINQDGAKSDFDFIGGAYTLMAKHGADKCKPIFDGYRQNGYDVVFGLDNLKKAKSKKILVAAGTAEKYNDFPYTIDSIKGAPCLRQLTEACLGHMLNVSPDHFYMMVEAGNIDHAAHSNDGATVVKEVLNFQESINVAYQFYLQHPDETLIVVTADHDTGGMTLGVQGGRKVPTLADIDWRRISKENFNQYCAKHPNLSWDEVKQIMIDKIGLWSHIDVTEEEEAEMKEAYSQINTGASEKTLYNDFNHFSSVVFNIVNHKNGIGFTTFSHTGNPVPVFAIGVGSDIFKSINNNIEIPQKIRELLDIK